MGRNLKELIGRMTLEEKAGMCSGFDFWHLKSVERLGIPAVMVTDGPHGLRKQAGEGDHLGINDSVKAVCFPAACATAASFDRELITRMGEALGNECQAEDVSVLLGPGINMKRSPLCGRNFEYFSEDPYLAGEMGTGHVLGVQSQNAGTSLKHFAANNQEHLRMSISSQIDERALREIYLTAFEKVVKEAKPWTVMCSYNRLNGVYASENHKLLTEILRDEWGFEGYVVSDWGAVNDRVEGLKAGLDLEMPASGGNTDAQIVAAVRSKRMDEAVLDTAVERILRIIFAYADHKKEAVFDREADHRLAVEIEKESAVLLKNDDGILPLKKDAKVVFIGEYAKKPRFQGGGSSHINSTRISNALEEAAAYGKADYVYGFPADKDEMDEAELTKAVEAAKAADTVVIFAGLPDSFESEGYDRTHMRLPECQNRLIAAVSAVQPNTVLVLHNGSPIEMPWKDSVKAILELYLGGEGCGEATAALLYGEANPCGRLPETFPLKLSDNPSYLYFPGGMDKVEYREGIFVGYRYYDKKELEVLYPFGYGLSYTSFAYSNLRISTESMSDQETAEVMVDVTNTGSCTGKEVVQLYVSDHTGLANRPVRELKGFVKVELQPGETKTVTMTLNKRSFAWYSTQIHDWYCGTGSYTIQIGRSSRDIVLEKAIHVEAGSELPFVVTMNTTLGELMRHPKTRESLSKTTAAFSQQKESSDAAKEAISDEMNMKMMEYAPIRSLRSFMGLSDEKIEEMVDEFNRLLQA